MKRDVILFIEDIAESIRNIESFSRGLSEETFCKDKLRQSAILRELGVIGEAAKNVPANFRSKYSAIPWKDIAGFRDILSHAYFEVTLGTVWRVLEKDIPELKKEIEKIIIEEKKNA